MKNQILKLFILIVLFLGSNALFSYGQDSNLEITISGTVYDDTNVSLPGVKIFIKNQPGLGTVSDNLGKFTIKAPKNEVIVFSYVGFQNYEYRIEDPQNNLRVTLTEDDKRLDEVVVTALGVQKKVSLVGAISTIDVSELEVPTTSISNVMGGRIPGVISMQYSGEPGRNVADFWIRGIGTFGYNSGALVLIDGLEGSLHQLDPSDIQSFSILKDASATAVYGVRGANGVVLVTTKRGTEEKLKITLRTNLTLSHINRMPEYLGAYDYAVLANEARVVSGLLPLYSNSELNLIQYNLDPDLFPNVNWQDEILNRNSLKHSYYINAQGGGSIARYFISLGASSESSAYKQDPNSKYRSLVGYDKYTYRTNLDINLTKTSILFFGLDGFIDATQRPGFTNTNQLWYLQRALTPLTIPTMYSNGAVPAYGVTNEFSPYVMLNHTGRATNSNFKNLATIALGQKLDFIAKGLDVKMQGAVDYRTYLSEGRYLLPEMYNAIGRSTNGELQLIKRVDAVAASPSRSVNQYSKYLFETTLNYVTKINSLHDISSLLYYYMSSQKDSRWSLSGLNSVPMRYQGISGRVTYGYDNTYFLDLNFGYTGSENFQPGRQFGFFPSIAGGFIPTNYDFFKEKLPFLTYLKLRASYGIVGNDRISNARFPYLTIVNSNAGTGWGYHGPGISESIIGADNLIWEKAKKANLGIDGALFKDMLTFTVDVYRDERNNIFQSRTQVPDYVGLVNMPYGNVGRMHSWGSDGNVAFKYSISNNSSFTLRGNYTYADNMVDYWEQPAQPYPYQTWSNTPLGVRRGFIALGLFRDELDVKSSPPQFGMNLRPGDIKYKDVNADGVVNSDDLVPIAYQNFPRLMYGFGGEFNYKNFTLGMLFRGSALVEYFRAGEYNEMGWLPFWGGNTGNVLSIVKDQSNRWTPAWYSGDPATENPNAKFPRLRYGNDGNSGRLSNYWKEDGSYIRMQEINLNYRIHANDFLKAIGVQSIDLQLIGQNLFTIDKVKHFDPEQAEANGGAYPIPATYSFQLYVNF